MPKDMTVAVRKAIRISAAHHIPNHPGKCARPHGHNYLVEAFVKGPVDPETGMIKDFYDISKDLEIIVGSWDHQDLNEMVKGGVLIAPFLTTAENLAEFWLAMLRRIDDRYDAVKVWETEDSYALATAGG